VQEQCGGNPVSTMEKSAGKMLPLQHQKDPWMDATKVQTNLNPNHRSMNIEAMGPCIIPAMSVTIKSLAAKWIRNHLAKSPNLPSSRPQSVQQSSTLITDALHD
jgi:hypothetical protein